MRVLFKGLLRLFLLKGQFHKLSFSKRVRMFLHLFLWSFDANVHKC